jgi:hypothetical protein
MKIWMTAIVLLLAAGIAGAAETKTETKKEGKGLRGQISKIDGMTLTVTSGGKKNPKTTEVVMDDKTTVTRDGKDAKATELVVGDYVMVTPASGTATSIKASSTKPERKPKV